MPLNEHLQAPEGRPFAPEEPALLIDRKGRRYLVTLRPGDIYHTHLGGLPHDELLGQCEGVRVRTSGGHMLLALRPTLSEYVLGMSRSSQVIYPKDLGPVLLAADIYPGATVVEAGIGSGALTLALLRAVGEGGRVISYEVRKEAAAQAQRNIRRFAPDVQNLEVKLKDIYAGIEEQGIDRVLLDLPEPHRVVEAAAAALRSGGIFMAFLPTVLQIAQLAETLRIHPSFDLIETVEVLLRPWHFSEVSARPVHRMVAHTGFITTARRCQPRRSAQPAVPPEETPEG